MINLLLITSARMSDIIVHFRETLSVCEIAYFVYHAGFAISFRNKQNFSACEIIQTRVSSTPSKKALLFTNVLFH